MKTKNAKFIKLDKISESMKFRNVIIEKIHVDVSIPVTLEMIVVPLIDHHNNILK